MNFTRVCDLKLWLLVLHVSVASNPHLCCARHVEDFIADVLPAGESLQVIAHYAVSQGVLQWWPWQKYFNAHNETTKAEAASSPHDNNGGGVATHLPSSTPESPTKFPDSKDGCNWAVPDQSRPWRKYLDYAHNETRIAIARAEAAADASSTPHNNRGGRFPNFPPSKDGCNWDDGVVSNLAVRGWDALNVIDELQFMAVDSCWMNRDVSFEDEFREVSCQQWHDPIQAHVDIFRGSRSFNVFVLIRTLGLEILAEGVYYPATGKMHLVGCTRGLHIPHSQGGAPRAASVKVPKIARFRIRDPEEHPVNSNSSSEVCAMAVTLQYPPVNPRWNSQRVMRFALRSTRGKVDPLYFDPVERKIFFPYRRKDFPIDWQRRIDTGGRILLLILGLVCVAKQIEHGRTNEEALPFVSLGMLGIQLVHHLSQTAIFKDLQIGRYWGMFAILFNSAADLNYYAIMAWSAYVPYQAITMAALFMYVWIFHRVGDRRRIMQLRVRKGRPGATDPPRDGPLVFATLAIFCIVGVLGFGVYSSNTGRTSAALLGDAGDQEFVSPRFYGAQWGFVNKVTGMVVSLFLVPQLLGNWRWEVQGRPLSAWLYVGLPFLQSLPHAFSIAKYFHLVPIFARFDPYLDSLYGIFEKVLVPWWEIGVVLCSALLVLAVHFQFAATTPLNRPSRHSITKPTLV